MTAFPTFARTAYFPMETATHWHRCAYGCEWLCFAPEPCAGHHVGCPDEQAIRDGDADRREAQR